MDNVLNDLDNILGRPPTETAATASAVNDTPAESMKTEKKSEILILILVLHRENLFINIL